MGIVQGIGKAKANPLHLGVQRSCLCSWECISCLDRLYHRGIVVLRDVKL